MIPTTLLTVAVMLHAPERAVIARFGTPHLALSDRYTLQLSPDGRRVTDGISWIDLATETVLPGAFPVRLIDPKLLDNGTAVGVDISRPRYALFDAATGRELVVLPDDEGYAFDPTGRQFARSVEANPNPKSMFIQTADWPAAGRQPIWRTVAETGVRVESLSFNRTGTHLIWQAEGLWQGLAGRIYVHALASETTTRLNHDPDESIYNFILSPDGKSAAVSAAKHLHLYDTATGKKTRSFEYGTGEKGIDTCLQFLPDGKWVLATGVNTRQLDLFPLDPEAKRRAVPMPAARIRDAVVTPDSKRVVVRDAGGVVRVYSLDTGKQLDRGTQDTWAGVAWAGPDRAVCWSDRGRFVMWDTTTGAVVREFTVLPSKNATGIAAVTVRSDAAYLGVTEDLYQTIAQTFRVLDLRTGKTVVTLPEGHTVHGVTFHPGGRRVEVSTYHISDGRNGRDPNEFQVFDLETGKRTHVQTKYTGRIRYHPDERTLFRLSTRPAGSLLTCSETATGDMRWQQRISRDHNRYLEQEWVCFGLDPKAGVVWFAQDRAAHGYSVLSGKLVWAVSGMQQSEFGTPLSASEDGRWLIACNHRQSHEASAWSEFSVYDLRSTVGRNVPLRSPAIRGKLRTAALSPDGGKAIALTGDGEQTVWDLDRLRAYAQPADPLATAWEQLAGWGEEAAQGMTVLTEEPGRAVRLLGEKLPPVAEPTADDVTRWLGELGSRDFRTREQAEKSLTAVLDPARQRIRTAAEKPETEEARERLHRLVSQIEQLSKKPEYLRVVRAVEVVERIGTSAAVTLLKRWADGAPDALLTTEAKRSLKRVK